VQGSPGQPDPVPDILVAPTSGLTTTETGDTAQFTVALHSQPLGNVTIGLASSNLNEGTVSPPSLTFTPANWNQPQTVTITGVADLIADGDTAYTIVLLPAVSADPVYNGMNPADVAVTNLDKTRIWDGGGTDNFWNSSANWSGDAAPLPGDILVFPAGAAQAVNFNNYGSGTVFHSIVFSGAGYTLQGNALRLSAGLSDNSTAESGDNTATWALITLTAPQTVRNLHLTGSLLIQSAILLGGNPLTVEAAGAVQITGNISGTAGITKTGDGLLTLTGVNSYSGETTVLGGEMHATDIRSANQPTTAVTVDSGGTLLANSLFTGALTIGAGARVTIAPSVSDSGGMLPAGPLTAPASSGGSEPVAGPNIPTPPTAGILPLADGAAGLNRSAAESRLPDIPTAEAPLSLLPAGDGAGRGASLSLGPMPLKDSVPAADPASLPTAALRPNLPVQSIFFPFSRTLSGKSSWETSPATPGHPSPRMSLMDGDWLSDLLQSHMKKREAAPRPVRLAAVDRLLGKM
jgi:autotransporter-associated beta strand protein